MEDLSIRKRVAVEVFGITDVFQFADKGCEGMLNTEEPHFPPPATCLVPAYESDIAAAWLVVQQLKIEGWEIIISIDTESSGGDYACILDLRAGDRDVKLEISKYADTAPMAICLAAIAAKAALQAKAQEGGSDE